MVLHNGMSKWYFLYFSRKNYNHTEAKKLVFRFLKINKNIHKI